MKKLLSLFFITITQLTFAQQGGLHVQWHKDANGQFFKNVNDTVYLPVKIANNSNHNAVAAINLNTEEWSYLPATGPFSFSLTVLTIISAFSNSSISLSSSIPKIAFVRLA